MAKQPKQERDLSLANVPKHLADSVIGYIQRAHHLGIDHDRVRICACLLVAAERSPECHLPRGRYVSTVPWSQLAALVGLSDVESLDRDEVAKRYGALRQAKNQLHESSATARRSLGKLRTLLERHQAALPEELQILGSDLRVKILELERLTLILLTATHQTKGNPLKSRREKIFSEKFGVSEQTFIWWRLCLVVQSGLPGIWEDMHRLARVWELTEYEDVEVFRRAVVRLTQGVTEFAAPPKWCLKLCHFKR